MSWWNIDKSDVIGDRPADIVGDALASIAAMRRSQDRPLPTLQETVDAMAVALGRSSESFMNDNGHTSPPGVIVELSSGIEIESRPEPVADDALVTAFMGAFSEMADTYISRWGRRPRRNEALYTVKFVLRPDPSEYVADPPGEGVTIKSVTAEWPTLNLDQKGRRLAPATRSTQPG